MGNKLHAQKIVQMIHNNDVIPVEDIQWICCISAHIFSAEPNAFEVNSPIIVVGAQIDAVLYIFENYGSPEINQYIFLDDFFGPGPTSIHTLVFLLAYKILFQDKMTMIRGNHEDVNVSSQSQFRGEMIKTYKNSNLFNDFSEVFSLLPLTALVNNTILYIHGGLGPAIRTIDTIRAIKRPFTLTDQDPMYDRVWADQDKNVEEYGNGKRSTSCSFGLAPLHAFFELYHWHD